MPLAWRPTRSASFSPRYASLWNVPVPQAPRAASLICSPASRSGSWPLDEALDVSIGLSVEQSAVRLGVSQPTVRKWIRDGLLDAVPGRKPAEVSQAAVLAVESILERVGDTLPERSRTRALAAYLHDRDLLGREWAVERVAAYRRGELEPM